MHGVQVRDAAIIEALQVVRCIHICHPYCSFNRRSSFELGGGEDQGCHPPIRTWALPDYPIYVRDRG